MTQRRRHDPLEALTPGEREVLALMAERRSNIGIAHQLWLVLVLLAFGGAADLVSAVFRQTILQTYAPDEMRGRMQAVNMIFFAGGPQLGEVEAGAVARLTSGPVSVISGGIACVALVGLVTLAGKSLRTYTFRPEYAVERGPIKNEA